MVKASGSSPLARGLHEVVKPQAQAVGIIPARAGFTSTTLSRRMVPRDHPRSRGVYRPEVDHGLYSEGSSPLARGLRSALPPRRARPRIIPARAGFTDLTRSRTNYYRDHPRSRGVYQSGAAIINGATGSSPLARGLPDHGRAHHLPVGIIPARAGFTQFFDDDGNYVTDHPRSRGVYVPGHA